MRFLIALIVAIVFVATCKNLIREHPIAFYVSSMLLDLIFVASTMGLMPPPIKSAAFLLIQRCTLSVALFVIVAYVGVFAEGSPIRRHLMPIRAELSIIACILALGHIVVYLSSYIPMISAGFGGLRSQVALALGVSVVLTVLLAVLGITSFNFVKKRMSAQSWKKLQRWAYLFYAFIYVHLMLMLVPSAVAGTTARFAVVVYSTVFIAYFVLRVCHALADCKGSGSLSQKKPHPR
jgi:sulfoxide reductase heme-binding subunit YedZ